MGLLVLAYPELAKTDTEWIEALRSRYNSQDAAFVGPHVTLLFETTTLSPTELVDHVQRVVGSIRPIDLVFRSVMVMPGIVVRETFLFLVPDEGLSAVARLHDCLYSGALAAERRLDIPYVPHMTLGRFESPAECRDVAEDLMRWPVAIAARIAAVDVADYDGRTIRTLKQVCFSGQ